MGEPSASPQTGAFWQHEVAPRPADVLLSRPSFNGDRSRRPISPFRPQKAVKPCPYNVAGAGEDAVCPRGSTL
nr:unnamed protein product [Digitaria exilis]